MFEKIVFYSNIILNLTLSLKKVKFCYYIGVRVRVISEKKFLVACILMVGNHYYTNYIERQYATPQITTSKSTDEVKIEGTNCERDEDFIDVKGYVKNVGNLDYYYVDVKISLKNENGEVLDTYNTYAVGGE